MKPLSVNKCYTGQRWKTDAYRSYEKEMLARLPAMKLPPPPFFIAFEFGMSNSRGDLDNPTKICQDILAKKYGFNDSSVMELHIRKVIVPKGEEYISFSLNPITL